MSLNDLVKRPLWERYSKKMQDKICSPRSFGCFTRSDAIERGMRYVRGEEGSYLDGALVRFYWLVDESDGVIVDARFQLFGISALIAAAEVACELVVGKNYDQAKRIGADLIDKQLRDHPDQDAFPVETLFLLNVVVDALDATASFCNDLPLPESYVSPLPEVEGERYPGWEELSYEKKVAVIEEVIAKEIRPYIELDAGGIQIVELKEERELVIAYQGACTSCFSAVGTTLSTIQQIIRAKVHPDLTVIPDMTQLSI